eukprot:TRINITY_DN10660_c0_g1_i1.p1 TRINITY_DN10660_c0_g1~~TRINITY_DN10660_c0_g1_i1.p1  ORF type:complete len:334 (-),score=16.10 TRINITY_DN10660_c0_g1_i1:44-1045(-)
MPEYFHIISESSGLALDVSWTGKLIVLPLSGEETQQFTCNEEGYIFAHSGKILDLRGGVHLGHKVVTHKNLNQPSQKWRLEFGGIIRLEGHDLVLDIKGDDRGKGAGVIGWYFNGNSNQRWKVIPVNEPPNQALLTGDDRYLYDDNSFTVIKKGLSGDSVSINAQENRCLKKYQHYDSFLKETKYTKLLSDSKHFPTYYADIPNRLLFSYCGARLTRETIPNDYEEQINEIIEVFRAHSITHNDIHPYNMLLLNGNIKLIDFAYMAEIKDGTNHLIPKPMVDLVKSNLTDVNIRLAAEAECLRISIQFIRDNPKYKTYSNHEYRKIFQILLDC